MAAANTSPQVVNFTCTPGSGAVPEAVTEILSSYGASAAKPLEATPDGYYTTVAKPLSEVRKLVAELNAETSVVIAFAPSTLRPVDQNTL